MIYLVLILIAQPILRDGWPVKIISYSYYGNWGGPKAYDIDFDGEKEILFAAGSPTVGGILYAINLNGTYPPGWPVSVGEPPLFCEQSPVVGDIDNDGVPEIVVGTFGLYGATGGIYAFEFNGTLGQNFPISAPPYLDIMMPLTLAEIVPEYVPMILVSFTHYSGDSVLDEIAIIDPLTGDFIEGWPLQKKWFLSRLLFWQNDYVTVYYQNTTGSDSGYIGTWSLNGNVFPNWPHQLPGFPGGAMPTLADLDNDQVYELIAPWHGPAAPNLISYLAVYKPDGTVLPGFPLEFPGRTFQDPSAIADIDQNDSLEIVIDSYFYIHIINKNGVFSYFYTGVKQFFGEPAIADVNSDESLDIIIGRSHRVENDSSYITAFTPFGSQLPGWPVWVIGSPFGTPLIDDLDGDGYLEMVVFTKGTPWVHPDTGWLYLFDLPAPFDSAMVPWGQYAHDLWNSGIYGFNPPVSVAEKTPLQIPSSYQVVYKNGIPELVLTLNSPQALTLNLYDVTGRMLWRNVSRYPSGTHRLKLPGNIPSGLHILKLRGDQTQALKVIKLR